MTSKAKKPGLIDKSFKVPVDVIRSIEELAPVFGSNGRAIQVGTEFRDFHPEVPVYHVPGSLVDEDAVRWGMNGPLRN